MKKTRVWPALLAALVILAGCAAAPPEESDPPTEEFVFTRENMPRLNGSTSAVPLAGGGVLRPAGREPGRGGRSGPVLPHHRLL